MTTSATFGFGAQNALRTQDGQERDTALACLASSFRRDQADSSLVLAAPHDAEVECVCRSRLCRLRGRGCQRQACQQASREAETHAAQARTCN